VASESCAFIELLQGGEERQLAGLECLLQIGQEQPAEETRQDADRKEEAWPAGDPACAIRRNATTVRIPTMPSGHTELEASTCSNLMPSTVLR
jgi:hypothetical protein